MSTVKNSLVFKVIGFTILIAGLVGFGGYGILNHFQKQNEIHQQEVLNEQKRLEIEEAKIDNEDNLRLAEQQTALELVAPELLLTADPLGKHYVGVEWGSSGPKVIHWIDDGETMELLRWSSYKYKKYDNDADGLYGDVQAHVNKSVKDGWELFHTGSSGFAETNNIFYRYMLKKDVFFVDIRQEAEAEYISITNTHGGQGITALNIGTENIKGGEEGVDKFEHYIWNNGLANWTDDFDTHSDAKAFINDNKGMVLSNRIYVSGGIMWAMSTLSHPERPKQQINILTLEDVENIISVFQNPHLLKWRTEYKGCEPCKGPLGAFGRIPDGQKNYVIYNGARWVRDFMNLSGHHELYVNNNANFIMGARRMKNGNIRQ